MAQQAQGHVGVGEGRRAAGIRLIDGTTRRQSQWSAQWERGGGGEEQGEEDPGPLSPTAFTGLRSWIKDVMPTGFLVSFQQGGKSEV